MKILYLKSCFTFNTSIADRNWILDQSFLIMPDSFVSILDNKSIFIMHKCSNSLDLKEHDNSSNSSNFLSFWTPGF